MRQSWVVSLPWSMQDDKGPVPLAAFRTTVKGHPAAGLSVGPSHTSTPSALQSGPHGRHTSQVLVPNVLTCTHNAQTPPAARLTKICRLCG